MIYSFADFELDIERRELRLLGREIAVQPKVFDLLTYLIEHRERVVSKDELLDVLWPGAVVVDGALQRVVSLARSALLQGGQRGAIRTYARRGYRFDADAAAVTPAETIPVPGESTLEQAGRAYQALDWHAAMEAFAAADLEAPLAGVDLERAAQARIWAGNPMEAIALLERAIAANQSQRDRHGAARAAIMLAQIFFERLDTDIASGWFRRALRFLKDSDVSRERGLAHYLAARIGLMEGSLEQALADAERTCELGLELEDPDLEGLGLVYMGHALLALGSIERGLECQNEAAAAALSGLVSPWVGALIFCGVVWACRNRADWDRAAQWSEQFSRWCDDKQMSEFPGTCRLHRAEILSVRGDTEQAEREILDSMEALTRNAPWAEGDAYRILGDLMLGRGDLDGAAAAYQKSRELGWDPEPGYSLLLLDLDRAEDAVNSLEAALDNRSWAAQERRGLLLAHLVLVAALADRHDRASAALVELEANPELQGTPAVAGVLLRGRAEIAYREQRLQDAIRLLRGAIASWQSAGSPLNVAHLRLRQHQFLMQSADRAGAEIELTLAQHTFEQLHAASLVARCEELRQRSQSASMPAPNHGSRG